MQNESILAWSGYGDSSLYVQQDMMVLHSLDIMDVQFLQLRKAGAQSIVGTRPKIGLRQDRRGLHLDQVSIFQL